MDVTNFRNRNRTPINFEDGIYVKGLDIISLVKQVTGNETMAYGTNITNTTERYIATQPGTGYSVGETIVRTEIFDLNGPTPISTVVWHNYSQSVTLTVAPNIDTLSLQGQSALTNNELRARPVIVTTDITSPEIVRMGDIADPVAPDNGIGNYAIIPALKRMVMHLFSINSRLPSTVGRKGNTDSLAVALSLEQENLLSSQVTKLDNLFNQIGILTGKFPASVGPKANEASLSVVVANQPIEWESVGMVMGADGYMSSETERNPSGATRTRSWTTVNNAGVVTLTASAWVYS